MTGEGASALTDVLLSAGTFVLAFTVGNTKSYRTWTAFFLMLGAASGVGAIFHGTARFHTHEFWTLVSTSSCASAFLFIAACLVVARPHWKWLHWLWPAMGIAGLLVGGLLAPFPFAYVATVALICIIVAVVILTKAPTTRPIKWIYAGMIIAAVGFIAQQVTHMDGLLSPNALFHLLLLAGNVCLWKGAKHA